MNSHSTFRLRILSLSLLCLVGAGQAAFGGNNLQPGGSNGFDIQPFRPTPAPRDLIIAPQTQPISHLSVSAGVYLSFSLDPFSFKNTGAALIKNRVQLDLMAAFGIGDWVEFGAVFPIILFQDTDIPRSQGYLNTTVIGDLSLMAKAPIIRRRSWEKGWGLALAFRMNFPTGFQDDFAGDGTFTYNPTAIVDYRFGTGILITFQAGVYLRPGISYDQFSMNTTFTSALAAEVPVIRSRGLGLLGGVYVNVPTLDLATLPNEMRNQANARKIAAEAMFGIRWYSSMGLTFTTGLNFGMDCGFGIPTFRYFLAVVWVPKKSREYQAIEDFKNPPDIDNDGLVGDDDLCPEEAGPKENKGCPDTDRDYDTVVDRLDKCPYVPGLPIYQGCPRVYIEQNMIKLMEKVNFATDQDVILLESFPVLDDVAKLLVAHPEILEVQIQGHTDSRASAEFNLDLSERRAKSVKRALIARGISEKRLETKAFGKTMPIIQNAQTEQDMAVNRRVEFVIMKQGAPPIQAAAATRGTTSGANAPATTTSSSTSASNAPKPSPA